MEAQASRQVRSRALYRHLFDSTAILAESTPVLALFETQIAGMRAAVSLRARLIAAGLTYFAGTGYLYAKGRELSRRLFGIRESTAERTQALHDAAYLGAFNLVLAPLLYLAAGSRDARAIAVGTLTAVLFGLVNGGPMGYAVDLFRDLAGLKPCMRPLYPEWLQRLRPPLKMALLALLVGAAAGVTALIYALSR